MPERLVVHPLGATGDRPPRVVALDEALGSRAQVIGEDTVGQHSNHCLGELLGLAGFEGEGGAGAGDEFGQTAGLGDDEWGAAGERLEGHDTEWFVQRRDDDAGSSMDGGAQGSIGELPGQVDDVADPGHIDL